MTEFGIDNQNDGLYGILPRFIGFGETHTCIFLMRDISQILRRICFDSGVIFKGSCADMKGLFVSLRFPVVSVSSLTV